jgi:uncharacterized membrane protein YjjP (DUF1212 family)
MTPALVKTQPVPASMTLEQRSSLVLAVARVLFINGDSTYQILNATQRLSEFLGLRTTIFPCWAELKIQTEVTGGTFISAIEATPSGVDMDRVASTLRTVRDLCDGRADPAGAMEEIKRIENAPHAYTWLFTLAAGACAAALAIIFGIRHPLSAALIFMSAAAGAILRRTLARYSTNLLQPFGASFVAGVVGALAVHCGLSSSLRLIAVCPCMVLVPGPHFLNGMLDLIRGRMNLGAARLLYAVLIVVAISTGLLLGLGLFGVSLPVDSGSRAVPLWHDVIAAGVAVACYSIFFSSPLNMLPWPVAVGAMAHALRWVVLTTFRASAATGAFAACLIVGMILAPVTRRWRMPFAAIGFASVVSMIPGVLMFRVASGLLQFMNSSQRTWELFLATLTDGGIAASIILAMSVGLIVPKLVDDYVSEQ